MDAIFFEHVPVTELPEIWRVRLAKTKGALVTVRIEEEVQVGQPEEFTTDDPAFGIWRDREDTTDVAAYVRELREPRYNRDGSRKKI